MARFGGGREEAGCENLVCGQRVLGEVFGVMLSSRGCRLLQAGKVQQAAQAASVDLSLCG